MRRFLPLLLALGLACSAENAVAPNLVDTTPAFPVSTPEAEGLSATALADLIAEAKAQNSDALIVVRNGKLVYEDYFGKSNTPMPAMSMTKSFVSVAFGFLLAEGKLASLDEPVAKMIPGFAAVDARKASMTYRHLLSMTSGIDPTRGLVLNDIEAHAVASVCRFAPGASWQYSNNGVLVLSLLVGKLAGKQLDQYLADKLFAPLGISDVVWRRDRRGVPYGDGELSIRPIDVAKIGQMILDGGKWRGQQIIRPEWIDQSWAQTSPYTTAYGLLWWRSYNGPLGLSITNELLSQWHGNGIPDSLTKKLAAMIGVKYQSPIALLDARAALLTPAEHEDLSRRQAQGDHIDPFFVIESAPGRSRYMAGWLGQFLDIVADRQLVAVRMRRPRDSDYQNTTIEVDGFPNFVSRVARLVP